MLALYSNILELRQLDVLASLNSPIHRLDPRAKILATLGYIVTVVSFPKYEVAALVPFLAFPLLLIAMAGIPFGYLIDKIVLALPFATLVGLANPFLDHNILFQFGSISISGGWVSFSSILLRCSVSVAATLTLVATTGMNKICLALERLKVPRTFVIQLLFLYRYLFVLLDETGHLQRARQLRISGRRTLSLKIASQLIAQLLLRSIDRAQRIYLAMSCRGFNSEFRRHAALRFNSIDVFFLFGCLATFGLLRVVDLHRLLGCFLKNFLI